MPTNLETSAKATGPEKFSFHSSPKEGQCRTVFKLMHNYIHFTCQQGRRTDAFELWCWRRLLRVSWTTRRPNQSILKEISPEYSLEGLMLKLKLQYFGHLTQRTDSLEKPLMLRKIEGRRRRRTEEEIVGWYHQLCGHKFEQAPGVGDGQGILVCCSPWGLKKSTE